MSSPRNTPTLLDALLDALRTAAAYDRHDMAPPAAVLWTDPEGEWQGAMADLRAAMPHLLTLGPPDAATRSGPAIWCKGVLGDPAAFGMPAAAGAVPVIYMPGVAKEAVRGVETCAPPIRPLVELQYRGVLWTHVNGRDWTVRGFLSSETGLNLRVARDGDTARTLIDSLPVLLRQPVARLREQEINAAYLQDLLTPDVVRTLLRWMCQPSQTRQGLGEAEWTAFTTECKRRFGVRPGVDDPTKAGEQLARRKGEWAAVWERFLEAPDNHPGMVDLLKRSKPAGVLFAEAEPFAFPQDNEQAEAMLRDRLNALADAGEGEARRVLLELEADHGQRRGLVWAKLGQAPLATALEHLAELARRTERPLAGASLADAIAMYAADGWRTDSAVIQALAAVRTPADHAAVSAGIRSVYAGWLDKSAKAFQMLAAGGYATAGGEQLEDAGVILFADGLRMDVGRRLEDALKLRGFSVTLTTRLAALPTATVTAKPAVSPVDGLLGGSIRSVEFTPEVAATGKPLTQDGHKRLMKQAGYEYLKSDAGPAGGAKHWTEFGTLDKSGHSEQTRLAARVADEVSGLADRVAALLDGGAAEVRVVTDHGWLLLPGGLPKVDLPKSLTDTRWSRCAAVKPGAEVEFKAFPWRFCEEVSMVSPPGCGVFMAGDAYAHGGISPQECVTPVLTVRRTGGGGGGMGMARAGAVAITGVTWAGLAAKVTLSGGDGLSLDIRTDGADAGTSIRVLGTTAEVKSGRCTVYLQDDIADGRRGEAVEVVALDPAGAVVARYTVRLPE